VRIVTVYRECQYAILKHDDGDFSCVAIRSHLLPGGASMARARKKISRKKILCIEDDRETAALIAEDLTDRASKSA
jgi:hypothetical protein